MEKQKRIFDYEQLSAFCLSLAHLLHAGLLPGDALSLLEQDEVPGTGKQLLKAMAESADAGVSLSRVLEASDSFPAYVCSMAAAGEETGRLEEAFFALADYYDNAARLERRLKTTLLQPLVLFGVLTAVTAAILVWVLPVFDDVYRQLGASLTGVAGGLLSFGQLLRKGAPVLIPVGAALCAGCLWMIRSPGGRDAAGRLMRRRGAFSAVDTARLTQVLSMALRSGLDSERAVELTLSLGEEDTPFHRSCGECLKRLRGEADLPRALRESGLLPAADCRLLEAGCRSGCADTVMKQLADRARERSESQLELWLSRIEPALVLTGSALVGVILLSVLLPLTRIMAAIG